MFKANAKSANHPTNNTSDMVSHEKIAMRAFDKWCKKGRPHGTHVQDWLDAERELEIEASRSGKASHRR